MTNIFFECTVFIFGFSQIRQPDIHHTDKNNRYYSRIKNDFWSLVSYNVTLWYTSDEMSVLMRA